jgi:hypothetical protein
MILGGLPGVTTVRPGVDGVLQSNPQIRRRKGLSDVPMICRKVVRDSPHRRTRFERVQDFSGSEEDATASSAGASRASAG